MTLRIADANYDGAIIGLFLDPATAQELAVPGGEDPSEMHITVLHLSDDAAGVADEQWEACHKAIEETAAAYPRLIGSTDGLDTFPDNGDSPWFMRVDISNLAEAREMLKERMAFYGWPIEDRFPTFEPHITLVYGDRPDEPLDVPLDFDALTLAKGRIHQEFPLGRAALVTAAKERLRQFIGAFKAAKESVLQKAYRLYSTGKVTVGQNTPTYVSGTVKGDTGTYEVNIYRDNPNSSKISYDRCDCDWETYRWDRTRQWTHLEGKRCSHSLALDMKARETPLDLSDAEEGYKPAPGQRTKPLTEDEEAEREYDRTDGQIPVDDAVESEPATFSPDDPAPDPSKMDSDQMLRKPMDENPWLPTDKPAGPDNPLVTPRQRQPMRLHDIEVGGEEEGEETPQPGPGQISIPGLNPPGWEDPNNPNTIPGTFSRVAALDDRIFEPMEDVLIDVQLASMSDPSSWVRARIVEHVPDTEGEAWDEDDYVIEWTGRVPDDPYVQEWTEGGKIEVPASWVHGVAEDWVDQEPVWPEEKAYHRASVPVFVTTASDFHYGSEADDMESEIVEALRHGRRVVFALRNPVALEASGGKIPKPGAQPIGENEDGLPIYKTLDLGWDPVRQRRVNQSEMFDDQVGSPDLKGQYGIVQPGREGEILDIEPAIKSVFVHIPIRDVGKLHPHLLSGWVEYDDVVLLDTEGDLKSPFRRGRRPQS